MTIFMENEQIFIWIRTWNDRRFRNLEKVIIPLGLLNIPGSENHDQSVGEFPW